MVLAAGSHASPIGSTVAGLHGRSAWLVHGLAVAGISCRTASLLLSSGPAGARLHAHVALGGASWCLRQAAWLVARRLHHCLAVQPVLPRGLAVVRVSRCLALAPAEMC